MKIKFFHIFFLFSATTLFAQNDSIQISKEIKLVVNDTIVEEYDPLAPSRAAFYSAIVPGLGQAYNKKYWKIPLIYGGMAAGVYFYLRYDKDYDRFRDVYKRRLAGFTDDEFFGTGTTAAVSNQRLIDAQKNAQKNKDIWVIITVGVYMLNIIDANVDAHLRQYNISEDLSLKPNIDFNSNPFQLQPSYGLSLKYSIK